MEPMLSLKTSITKLPVNSSQALAIWMVVNIVVKQAGTMLSGLGRGGRREVNVRRPEWQYMPF